MKSKRILAILLLISFLFASACADSGSTASSTPPSAGNESNEKLDVISILYSSNDSLDPYKAETELNRRLGSLLFDPLFKLNTKLQPEKILAKSIELNGTECIITLKNAFFSDGTPVTADDVAFSLKKATEAQLTAYPEQLASVKSYEVQTAQILKIQLKKADPYFANLLDFPIMKKGSDTLHDENNIELPPIGSGRYVFDIKLRQLNANQTYISGKPSIETVKLINAPDDEVITYNLEVGNVSLFHTELADGIIPPMSGTASTVDLNSLVYIGVNLTNKLLSQSQLRYALASAIDRAVICNDIYYSYARPASGLFSSVWEDAGNLQNLKQTADLENVIANLNEIGYNNKNEEGIFTDSNGKALEFKLLTYKDNAIRNNVAKLISEQMKTMGIKLQLVEADWDSYVKALTEGNFDLYLAETKLMNNMDASELVTTNGKLSYGIPKPTAPEASEQKPEPEKKEPAKPEADNTVSETEKPEEPTSAVPLLDNTVNGFYYAELSLVDIINAFNAEMPIIPVCHRLGLTVYDKRLGIAEMSTVSDVFFGIK